jgi:hypothetical protein
MAAPSAGVHPATYRYAAVGALTAVLVVFLIVTPGADWSRAIALALESVALVVAVATSRSRAHVRRARAATVTVVTALVVIATAVGLLPADAAFAAGGLLAVAIPGELVGGLLRLLRTEGVTAQAVAGAVAIYLLVGVIFAWTIALAARVDTHPYFAQSVNEVDTPAVYYSFTVLTTTGFGDYTAGSGLARAIAVAEMLTGQLYLVTVIGLLVGNFSRTRANHPGHER